MDQGLGVASPRPRLRHLPELAELGRARAQVGQESLQPGVVRVAAGGAAQVGDDLPRGGGPLLLGPCHDGEGRVGRVVEEPEPRLVAPLGRERGPVPVQRRGHRVPGQDVALGADHHRGQVGEPFDQPEDARAHEHLDGAGLRCRDPGQVEDVVTLVGVEPQRPDERADHLVRRVRPTSLLETHQVVHADPREHRHLFATQAGDATARAGRQPHVGRTDPFPGATQGAGELFAVGPHAPSMTRSGSALGRTAGPTTNPLWLDPGSRGTVEP